MWKQKLYMSHVSKHILENSLTKTFSIRIFKSAHQNYLHRTNELSKQDVY